MSRRPIKQQKIDDGSLPQSRQLQNILNCCKSADANIRKVMKQLGEAPGRQKMSRLRNAKFDSLKQTIKVPLLDGGEWDWQFCNPGLLVSRLVGESEALQAGFRDALSRHPSAPTRPWGLVVGFDEAVPGNKLSLVQSRKSMNLQFSFQELAGSLCPSCCGWVRCAKAKVPRCLLHVANMTTVLSCCDHGHRACILPPLFHVATMGTVLSRRDHGHSSVTSRP